MIEVVGQKAVKILPCALPPHAEACLIRLRSIAPVIKSKGRIIFIGRLDSYKRVDWLVRAISKTPAVRELHVIGDGPQSFFLKDLVSSTVPKSQRVIFHGQVSESEKYRLLSLCDLMVLPSDRCNEAFGIVQLEAMAAGLPSLAFDLAHSGMHWVSKLDSLSWSGSPSDLHIVLQQILTDNKLLAQLSIEARQRYDALFAYQQWKCSLERLQKSMQI